MLNAGLICILLTHLQAIGTKEGMVPIVEFGLAIVDTVQYTVVAMVLSF